MKKISIILLTLWMLGTVSSYAQSNQDILNTYLALKNDLIEADASKAAKDISALQKTIQGSDARKNAALVKAVDKMAKANSIDKQRKEFERVSPLLWDVIRNDKSIDQAIYYQYCPMKKAYWISAEESIKNPYYGKQMLTCGETVEKIDKK